MSSLNINHSFAVISLQTNNGNCRGEVMEPSKSPWAPKALTDQEPTGESFREIMEAQSKETNSAHIRQQVTNSAKKR